ncbi:alkylation response protein AidB-like acyl-CoA dehydrogenase [Halopolyspora algeriensis]|uniref:Alkylation response protein AidB-like acyl-CoA dehydrogenase n=1 Tax=Halopolyspora algeriensis TaxID=1500506 RepID=A0A368VIB9_9ACTN|nr:acyl-CoA dehydrogenase family protein [Halopolyspora algeriensis]RCW41007.1 alkylation response protein AidB-like acyl-CoA dehydrogenase [Halopolyspora algeriensis]TQM53909.1 alkylation response protein AidB-like acyl-CoA dehydrogenase [Halopolyspora algeriensis]
MDFELPAELVQRLADLDAFIDAEIRPLQQQDDNERFFDHRREFARTDFEAGGTPRPEWEALLGEMFRRADKAGWLRYGLPAEAGGSGGSNLDMAVIREHLAAKGLGLHNDLQNESSVVGNFPFVHMFLAFGTAEQKDEFVEGMLTREKRVAFGLTEPDHGSDATWLETTAVADGDDWILNGGKRFNSGLHSATHDVVFARTSGKDGDATGITAFLVPTDSAGFSVDFHWWTFNMPTDHAEVTLRDVRVPGSAVFGEVGEGLALAQHFVHENRIRQAASGVGAAQYCIDRSVEYTRQRSTFGQPLADRQAIQWPLVELQTEAELLRTLVRKTAWELDRTEHVEISDKVSMCNYRANRLVCDAADRAMQVHGGLGYTRHTPFEHIYRHHRRYRITEGSEEVQMRKVAGYLFGFAGPRRAGRNA